MVRRTSIRKSLELITGIARHGKGQCNVPALVRMTSTHYSWSYWKRSSRISQWANAEAISRSSTVPLSMNFASFAMSSIHILFILWCCHRQGFWNGGTYGWVRAVRGYNEVTALTYLVTSIISDQVEYLDDFISLFDHEYHFQINLNILMISFLMTEHFMRKTFSSRNFERRCSDLFKIN